MSSSQKIREALQAKRQEAQKAWTEFEPFQKAVASGEFDPVNDKETLEKAHEASKVYQVINGECKSLEEQYEKAMEMDGITKPSTSPLAEARKDSYDVTSGGGTPGQRVVSSETYRDLTSGNTLKSQNQAFRMEVKAMSREEHMAALRSRFDMKTLLQSENPVDHSSDNTGTLLTRPQRLPGYLELLQAPLKLRNLITVGATDNNTVEWVRQTAVAAGAAEVAEATATGGSSGTKPESGMAFDLQNTVVQTIAHWIPATRAALADQAQLQTIIDSQLLDGVARRLNTQIIKGDGNAPNLAGILSHPVLSQDDVVLADPGARKIERVLAAITKIRLAFLEPTAILMHPNDFQAVRLSKDNIGQYYFGPPSATGETHLWGLPVIEDVTVDEGEPIVGDWSQAILYVREDVNILASDSHSDFFVRNMIVILAEARYALAVPRPDAFCTVDFATSELVGPS